MSIGSFLGAAGVGSTIGQAIVQLELDSKKYLAEMKTAEASTKTSTSKLGSFFTTLKGLGSTAYIAIGAAAVAGLAASVNAALEAEDAHRKLVNTVKNAAQLGPQSVKAFEDQAEAIRQMTGADDEAIISGEALLGNMGLTQDQITDLAPLVVDLASKYDIDLQTAFKAVGKAAQGSTGTLARYVGTIEKGATPGETFTNVLNKLGGAAGYAADQARDQPWKLIASDFEEMGEDLGAKLLPAMRKFADGLRDLMPVIEFLGQALGDLIGLLGDLASALTLTDSGFSDAYAGAQALFNQYDQGKISIIELENKLLALRDETGLQVDVNEAYTRELENARDAMQRNRQLAQSYAQDQKKLGQATQKITDDFEFQEITLDELGDTTKVTRQAFERYFESLSRNSKDLRQVARELRDEKWINQDFIDFLSAKGPEWLVAFGDLNETQQKRWQNSWERSNERTKKANDNLGAIKDSLDTLNGNSTRHTVEIRYKYVGFDPSKPGMSPQQR